MARFRVNNSLIIFIILDFIIFTQLKLQAQDKTDSPQEFIYDAKNKRDPIISLINENGIRPTDELFGRPVVEEFSLDLNLNAILWDEKRPLVVIGGKVFQEGQLISRDIKLEKINPDYIIVDNKNRKIKIKIGGQNNAGQK